MRVICVIQEINLTLHWMEKLHIVKLWIYYRKRKGHEEKNPRHWSLCVWITGIHCIGSADNMFPAILSTSYLIIQKREKTLLRMILEYCSEQLFNAKKESNVNTYKHKECVLGLQLGFTQSVSGHFYFPLWNLSTISQTHIYFTSSTVILMTTATVLLAMKEEQCLLQIIVAKSLFLRESAAQELQRICYPPFPVLLSRTVGEVKYPM